MLKFWEGSGRFTIFNIEVTLSIILVCMYSAFRLEVAQSAAGPDLAFRAFLHYTYYVLK